MRIKRATKEDSLTLTDITRKSKAYWNYSAEQLNKWNNVLTISAEYIFEHQTYKLVAEEKIIGYYSFIKRNNNIIILDNMFVLPEYIDSGYGKLMMNDFLSRIVKTQARKIILEAEPNAELFYQKFGFATTHKIASCIKNRFLPVMELDINTLK